MKACSKCKRTDVEFHKNKHRVDGLQNICKLCKKEMGATYFQDSKEHHKNLNKERRQKARQHIWDYLKSHPCIDCGETDPIVLEFDHRSDKVMAVSHMITAGLSIEKIDLEIAKCDIRCAHCHRRKTAKELGWYKDLI